MKPRCPNCQSCCTKIHRLGVRLGGETILDDVNLHIHCGELTVLIGPNGAGKTTLFRAMLGEIPHSGQFEFHHGTNRGIEKPRIGYVPQRLDFDLSSPISVLDLFASTLSYRPLFLGYSSRVRKAAEESLAIVEGPQLLNKKLGQLSGGELQRVLLALALTPIPELLLLDEPVSGIDPAGTALFYKTVSELRTRFDLSVILVSHDIEGASKYADRMVFLNRKVVRDGRPQDVLSDEWVRGELGFHPHPHRHATGPRKAPGGPL